MNEKVLRVLEYNKIIDKLASFAGSEPARKMCLNLRPSGNLEWIMTAQDETEAALLRLFRNDRISFGANKDIRAMIKAVQIGRTLSISELLEIARLLECVEMLCQYGEKKEDDAEDVLDKYFITLSALPLLKKEINRCIINEDEIADDASSDLLKIRRSYASIGSKIHTQLTKMVNDTYRTYLQETVITMRNNRYCIPVRAEYKSQVPGMVHDQSSTGSTLFIEPAAIVNLNNELKELEIKERDEIEKILAGLTGRCAAHTDELLENQKTVTILDFIFAKAKYAMKLNATKPIFNDEHIINLRSARHPLLDQSKAVPIDVRLGEDFDLLIVTGPNTGGKTVSLKTVGLLTLMGQSGLHIPTLDRSKLSVFKEVYADIGDEQSIEQSLSTFSAHMTSIVEILKKANADSLCLFDELGAGTDPTEGAALAISILSYLHDRGIRSMATTHYSELKIYALSTEFVSNACCEFDVESLRPTYRLLVGIPGKSNAFAISKKLGLSDAIIENAKQYISTEEESFENVISDLEAQRMQIEKEQNEIENYKKEIEVLKNRLASKEEAISEKREKILREAREEAKDILKEAKDIADESIRAFQKQSTVMSIQTMEKKRANLRENIKKHENNTKEKEVVAVPVGKPLTLKDAVQGAFVHVNSLNIDGTIITRPDAKGNVNVQSGIISTKVNIRDLSFADSNAKVTKPATGKMPKKTGKLNLGKSATMSSEINVIGMTVDEAINEIDGYLSDACLAHVSSVRIVHGKGTGALRSGIHNYLRTCSVVRRYSLAAYGEGDAGVTIVEL